MVMADVQYWDCDKVCQWLEEIGLAIAVDKFRGECLSVHQISVEICKQ